MASPFLYYVDDRLSLAELTAARLDGHVVELGDAYIPADAVETRALRAGSLAALLGHTLAATHLTAAWVHGALPVPPDRHTVQRAVPKRLSHAPSRRVVYRDLAVDPEDLVLVGGVHVTTRLRTLVDLARVDDDEHARACRLVAADDPDLVSAAIDRLERGALPHKRAAVALLRGIAAAQAAVRTT
ncbi:hypothetical protein [Microbacterium sp. SSM24]|uniref:hypothetical protein n=1 Tax=Microbacterium sp. SSM24 TaxID=2991714 RepID=UPI00222649DD|nr:hypothetical protein [Microbacterium sp. SSM24]MCW3494531.1 hypothetical protein [Microbacterium sp. SSM24]